MVDRAVHQITQFVAERHPRTPLPVPLPVGKKAVEEEAETRTGGKQSTENQATTKEASRSGGSFTQHVHHRAIEMWAAGPKLVAQLGQVQLPEAVDVTIRQASR